MDPLAEKYYPISPYAYVANNPIIYIDPDGREKIIALDENNRRDRIIISGAEKFQEQNEKTEIHIFAHGNENEMALITDEGVLTVNTPDELVQFLIDNSEVWNIASGERITLVLQSCQTGKGESSIAQEISAHPAFENATVIAPNANVSVSAKGVDGTFRDNHWGNTDLSRPGRWRIFEGGEETGSFSGRWKPKGMPTLWDKIWYR